MIILHIIAIYLISVYIIIIFDDIRISNRFAFITTYANNVIRVICYIFSILFYCQKRSFTGGGVELII
jgi:hypothetical protein